MTIKGPVLMLCIFELCTAYVHPVVSAVPSAGLVLRPAPTRHRISPITRSGQTAIFQSQVLMKQGEEKEPVGAKLFGPENAGPWLILVVVWGFLGLVAVVPREQLPPVIQQLIPLVLGRQYGLPPGGT